MKKLLLSILIAISFQHLAHAGNCEGLKLSRQTFLSPPPMSTSNNSVAVAFFDADSTLRVAPSGSASANSPKDVMLLPGVGRAIALLQQAGYFIAIVSNQGGIQSTNLNLPCETADSALMYTIELIEQSHQQAKINYFDFAEFIQKDHPMRKPQGGMAELLRSKLNDQYNLTIDMARSFMVGDSLGGEGHFSDADKGFAQTLGIPYCDPVHFFGWQKSDPTLKIFDKSAQVTSFSSNFSELEKLAPTTVDELIATCYR